MRRGKTIVLTKATVKAMNAKSKSRRKGRRAQKAVIPKSMIGFPANNRVKMRYVTSVNFNLSSTGAAQQLFKANSIFDPDASIGGHQPLGHDQWNLFYNHYIVKSAKMKVEFTTGTNVANLAPCFYLIFKSDDAITAPNFLTLLEQGKCTYRMQNGNLNASTKKLSSYFSLKKFFNIKDVKDNVQRLGAAFGADPTDLAYFVVAVQTYDGNSSAQQHEALITIDYTVDLSEPKELPQS